MPRVVEGITEEGLLTRVHKKYHVASEKLKFQGARCQ